MNLLGAFGFPRMGGGAPLPGSTPTNVPINQPNPNPQPGDLPWIDHTGQPPAPPVWTGGITGKGQDPRNSPLPQLPPMGGTTRRGSQILDAQGNVIGHYDDNNQPVYHNGQGPSPVLPPGISPDRGVFQMRPMGVPGSMQQSLYGNGLLRPAMPSMNNQSGY